jgi:spermidine synthase
VSDEDVLRRRHDGATELRVNGVFVVDDVETSSERRLAQVTLDHGARDVLVGGLGLGHTVRALLAEPDVRRVLVAELHPEVVAATVLDDPRLEIVVADVRDLVIAQAEGTFDAVILDVDNGPDFLVHPENAVIYADRFVAACARLLRSGGTLAVWSMADSPTLRVALARSLSDVTAERIPVRLQGRDEAYWILAASRPLVGGQSPDRLRSSRIS